MNERMNEVKPSLSKQLSWGHCVIDRFLAGGAYATKVVVYALLEDPRELRLRQHKNDLVEHVRQL